MKRRAFVQAAMALLSFGASAQARVVVHRVTIFGRYFQTELPRYRDRWKEWFAENGFVEGRNLALSMVNTGSRTDEELEPIARDIVASRPSVIIVFGTPWTSMFKKLTREIPIVFLRVADPVDAGFVESLARPGANITGLANRYFDLETKRLEVLKELAPGARRVANLCERANAQRDDLVAAAKRLRMDLVDVFLSEGADAATISRSLRAAKVDAVLFGLDLPGSLALETLNRLRLPIIYGDNRAVEEGGLISLGERLPGPGRRAAEVASRILRGERPASIPVDQDSRIHLAVNLRAAREIALPVPASIRLRADQVIE